MRKRALAINNFSGVPGVSYSSVHHGWTASWIEIVDGKRKQKNRYFSITKYGETKAFKLAVAARKEAVKNASRI